MNRSFYSVSLHNLNTATDALNYWPYRQVLAGSFELPYKMWGSLKFTVSKTLTVSLYRDTDNHSHLWPKTNCSFLPQSLDF